MEVKKTSKYFVDLVESMKEDYTNLQSSINNQHNSYNKKLEIMNTMLEYNNSLSSRLEKDFDALRENNRIVEAMYDGNAMHRKNIFNSNKVLFVDSNKILKNNSSYDTYGNCIHPKVIGNLENVLNFNSSVGYIFKPSATVSINGESNSEYVNILKHDTIVDKAPVFNQYTDNVLTVTIDFPDNPLIGATNCNAIELSPFLAGAAVLKAITIITTPGTQLSNDAIIMDYDQPLEDTRILFDSIYAIKTLTLSFDLTFVNNLGLYPFGLRHIYLYNANFDTERSNIVIRNDYQNLIKYIDDNIIISNQDGSDTSNKYSAHETTCSEQGIKLYSYYANNNLLYQIETHTRDLANQLSRNTKVFYADIPVKKAMYSIEFKKVRT